MESELRSYASQRHPSGPSEEKMEFDLAETRKRLSYLPRGLMAHCQRTSKLCQELALAWGESEGRAAWAGLVHDLARPYPDGELLLWAREYGLAMNEIEKAMPLLLHGPVGAEVLRRNWGVADEALLGAVRWHTTGHKNMGVLAKIVFLADKLEPGKGKLYLNIESVRVLARKDLDRALLEFFNSQITLLLKKGSRIHPAMVEARECLQVKIAG